MYKVVFVRHGKTAWADRFTGWTDVDVPEEGILHTKKYALRLKEAGFLFDKAYTSYLKRAVRTLWAVLDAIDQMYVPIVTAWQLNERHYGALQGLNKSETAAKYGEEQVRMWRRSFDIPPPALPIDDPRSSTHEPRYAHLAPGQIPQAESLKETIARVVPYWDQYIAPDILGGKSIIISAHGNSFRAILKHIAGISAEDIMKLDIPYSIPLVVEFDKDLKYKDRRYLATDTEVEAILSEIRNQGRIMK
jgi:2,3-bisphosphoglycerate-dependent phosphoglycerate mutase